MRDEVAQNEAAQATGKQDIFKLFGVPTEDKKKSSEVDPHE